MSCLHVNGEEHAFVPTLNELLKTLGLDEAVVATALNGHFIPLSARDKTSLKSGDRVEVLAPLQGG